MAVAVIAFISSMTACGIAWDYCIRRAARGTLFLPVSRVLSPVLTLTERKRKSAYRETERKRKSA
jgi:hypothetical protein